MHPISFITAYVAHHCVHWQSFLAFSPFFFHYDLCLEFPLLSSITYILRVTTSSWVMMLLFFLPPLPLHTFLFNFSQVIVIQVTLFAIPSLVTRNIHFTSIYSLTILTLKLHSSQSPCLTRQFQSHLYSSSFRNNFLFIRNFPFIRNPRLSVTSPSSVTSLHP